MNYSTFIPQLLVQIPEFAPINEGHMKDYDHELLPHVLMGDFVRFFYDAYRKSITGNADAERWGQIVSESLSLMEVSLGSTDVELQNLISVSFVENLRPEPMDVDVYNSIRPMLGPKLSKELQYYDPKIE